MTNIRSRMNNIYPIYSSFVFSEQFQTQLKEQPSMGSTTQSVKYIVEIGFTEEQALDALIYTVN